MRRISANALILLFSFLCLLGTAYAQSPAVDLFKLSGTHTLKVKGAESWTVAREEIDELSGSSVILKNVANGKGEKPEFQLRKSKNRITIFHVVAKRKSFTRKFRIRVFNANEVSMFSHRSKSNPDVRTYISVPHSLNKKTRVLLVMHGLGRNADDYIASWTAWGSKNDYIVLSPEFDKRNWPGSRSYNLGNIFAGNMGAGRLNERSKWSFQVVEDILNSVRSRFRLDREEFDIFGHSAGGQFVHRFAFFMPDARIRIAIAANSGWYTLPDLDLKFPYGLKHSKLAFTGSDLIDWSARRVFILRGTADTERTTNLRQTPEADAQGKNRYERAGFMFDKMTTLNPDTKWRIIEVPGVDHVQKKMAVEAQSVLDRINSNRN